jgi:hypothetical protein
VKPRMKHAGWFVIGRRLNMTAYKQATHPYLNPQDHVIYHRHKANVPQENPRLTLSKPIQRSSVA